MFTRRHFLLVVHRRLVASRAPRLFAREAPAREAQTAAALPPSLAALTSMRARATPITNDERRARIEKAQRLMADAQDRRADADARHVARLLHQHPLGRRRAVDRLRHPGERQTVLRLPGVRRGPRARADRARARSATARPTSAPGTRTRAPTPWSRSGLKDRGIATGRLGIEETTKFVWSDGVAQAAPQLTHRQRHAGRGRLPDDQGAARDRADAAGVAGDAEGLRSGLPRAEPGMTQNTVSSLIDQGYARVGFRGEASVQVGEYTALPHGSIQPQTIKEGTIIMIDDGCTVEGYQSDITRTFVARQADRQDEEGLRHREGGADRDAEGGAARRHARGARRRRAQGDHRRRLRPRLQILLTPRRPRHGHGRPRVAVPGEEQHVRVGEGR